MGDLLAGASLRLLAAARAAVGPEWHYRDVVSPFARLYLVHAGEAVVRHDGAGHRLVPGRLHWIGAFARGDYRCARRLDHTYVHVALTLAGGLDLGAVLALPADAPAGPEDAARLARVVALRGDPAPAARLEEDALVRLVVAGLARGAAPAAPARAGRFAPVLAAIEERLAEPLPVAELAAIAGLHPTWFANAFSRRFGIGPAAWLRRRRLERAAALLRGTALRIEGIAAATGFAGRAHLSRQFARRYGRGPAAYRREAWPGEPAAGGAAGP